MMALLAAARRASALLRPMATPTDALLRSTAAPTSSAPLSSVKRMMRSSIGRQGRLRAKADSYRAVVDSHLASSHDGEVVRIIEAAMLSNNCSLVEEFPTDFPFKVNQKEGLNDITFTRSLTGEEIEVLVSVPTHDKEEEHDSNSSSYSDGYTTYSDESSSSSSDESSSSSDESSSSSSSDEGENLPQEHTVPLTVTISKADGSSLEFTCTAYPDKIIIDSLSMKQPEEQENDLMAFDVVEFSELDENLQQALNKYIELRGITPMNTKILHEHIVNKDRRQYLLLWLTKFREFIKKD